ncbi:MAG: hypothetical protein JWN14_5071 [Chthonomonadales bacterium]|nr:hypothetical protein [Chthonomonadales bacterium]
MLTKQHRRHFRALQTKEDNGTLSLSEHTELQAFVQLIDEKEAGYLRPATERIRQERRLLEEQNRALEVLVHRKERLTKRLERVLALSISEREKINAEVAAILDAKMTGVAP